MCLADKMDIFDRTAHIIINTLTRAQEDTLIEHLQCVQVTHAYVVSDTIDTEY